MLTTTSAERDAIRVTPTGRTSRRRRGVVAVLAIACASIFAGGDIAQAHQWSNYHWRRGGSSVYIYVYNQCGAAYNICEAARKDIHYRPHPVYLVNASSHTDISLLAGNYGATGWYGLAEIWWNSTYGAPHIGHGHATLNTYYPQSGTAAQQGTMCQEIGHTLGLTHGTSADCMAKSYYSPSSFYFGTASWDAGGGTTHSSGDLKNMYSTWHH